MKSVALKCKADQAMDFVLDWMRSGKLKVGDRLPSERELSEMLGISRLTLNKAMARLEDVALLSRSAGRGTYVAKLPAADAIAVICDIEHLSSEYHSPSSDTLIQRLLEAAPSFGFGPHFMVGRGSTAKEFIASLNMDSSVWREIKGVVAMAWKDGFEERLAEMGIPSVIIGCWNQGRRAVILDYEELGRIAFNVLKDSGAKKVCVAHNPDFERGSWNSPLSAFPVGPDAPFETDFVKMGAITPRDSELFAAGIDAKLKACDALFITNDTAAEGFAAHFAKSPSSEPPLVVVQASVGTPPELPPRFKRISFDPAGAAKLSLRALKKLRDDPFGGPAFSRQMLKPKLETGL